MEDRLKLNFIDMYSDCPEPELLNNFFKELALLKSSGCMDKLCAIAKEFEEIIDTKWPDYLYENQGESIILNMLGIKRSRYGSYGDTKKENGELLTGRPLLPFDMRSGEVTLLVGRPGTGKTEVACRAADLILNEHRKVIYFAFNEDVDSLKRRMSFKFKEALPYDIIFDTTRELTVLETHYGYSDPSSPDVMLERIEEMGDLHFGVGLIVIDFMQLFSYTHNTMCRLKELANRKHLHILAISQVSRASEGRLPERRDIDPALLNGADQIIGLYRTWGELTGATDEGEEPLYGAVK